MNHHIFCYLSASQVDPPDAGLLADILWPGVSSKGAANDDFHYIDSRDPDLFIDEVRPFPQRG